MTDLVRLVYISHITGKRDSDAEGLDPSIARILFKSRRNNQAAGIVGGLLFSRGVFFQCLEGPLERVEWVFARIQKDVRHQDVTVLLREPIKATTFGEWSMKFVATDGATRLLLDELVSAFVDPRSVTRPTVEAILAWLRTGREAMPLAAEALAIEQAAPLYKATPADLGLQWARGQAERMSRAARAAKWALALSLVNLVLVCVLLARDFHAG
jgi:hypothetical protein